MGSEWWGGARVRGGVRGGAQGIASQGGIITASDTNEEGTVACVINQGGSIRHCEDGVDAEDQHRITGRLVGQPARASMDDRCVPEEEGVSVDRGRGPVLGEKWFKSGGGGPGLGVGSGAVPRGVARRGGVFRAPDTDAEGAGACVISQYGSISR